MPLTQAERAKRYREKKKADEQIKEAFLRKEKKKVTFQYLNKEIDSRENGGAVGGETKILLAKLKKRD